jgi:hypothetical protein
MSSPFLVSFLVEALRLDLALAAVLAPAAYLVIAGLDLREGLHLRRERKPYGLRAGRGRRLSGAWPRRLRSLRPVARSSICRDATMRCSLKSPCCSHPSPSIVVLSEMMTIHLATTPATGIRVQARGDCLLMNFRGFATP